MARPAPWPIDKPLPSVLTPGEFAAVLGMAIATFYRYQHAGLLRRFEVAMPIGTARYSGALVDRLRKGDPIATFGAGSRLARRAS